MSDWRDKVFMLSLWLAAGAVFVAGMAVVHHLYVGGSGPDFGGLLK